MTQKKQILKSASVISLITIVSRIFGYIRDQRIALLLGTTPTADAFVLAYRIPNLLRRLVGEGSMTASFIPIFAGYQAHGSEQEMWDFANRLFWTLAVILAAITVAGMMFSSQLIHLLTFFAPPQLQWEQAAYLNRIMFPYVYFIGLAALAMAILNCFHIFATPATAPVLLNISIIACSVAAVSRYFSSPAVSLAAGVLIGGTLQFLIQIPQLIRRGMRFKFGLSFRHKGVRAAANVLAPGFFGIGVAQINFLIDTMFATSGRMPTGSVTALYVAERVMEMVLGGYAIAIATAILPLMSQQAAVGDIEEMKNTLAFSVRIVSFITIPAAVGLVVLRLPIIRVLFEHGQFVAESTNLTARALFYYAYGLPAFAAIKLIVPAFYSTHDTRTPVIVAGLTFLLNIVINVVCVSLFYPVFRNGGPALATVVAGYFNFFSLLAIFRARFGRIGAGSMLLSIGRIGFCSAVTGSLAWVGLRVSRFQTYQQFLPRLEVFAALLIGGVLTYLLLAWVMRCAEMGELYGIAMQRESEAAQSVGLAQ